MPWKPSYPGEVPTLGWIVLDFIETYLAAPDRGEYAPFVLYPEQADFVLKFFEIDPRTGRRKCRRGVISRPRGWGKSPFLASLALVESLAPVVPDGWDSAGQPVGRPWSTVRTPRVGILAVSEQQTANTWAPLLEMCDGPVLDAYPGLEPMDTFVNLPRGKIERITSSARTVKGAPFVFAVMDQALALDTPIPIPGGWSTMGALQAGDLVFGSNGQPVRVSQAKPVSLEHDCYRVTFSDGTSIVASDGHLWQTRIAGSAAKPKIRTTGEMYRDAQEGRHAVNAARRELLEQALLGDPSLSNAALAHRTGAKASSVATIRRKLISAGRITDVERRGGGSGKLAIYGDKVEIVGEGRARRFQVPTAPARVTPELDLPVHPYLLGMWLGDGTRGKCEIAVSEDDLVDLQRVLLDVGVETWPRRYAQVGGYGFEAGRPGPVNLTFSQRRGYQGSTRPAVAKALGSLDCYRDKHVPDAYLNGSIEQRSDLVRGLMDSDGCATTIGVCTFVNTNRQIAESLVALLRSLGQVTSAAKWVADDRYTGGGKYRVDFTPRGGFQPFRLSRKAQRVRQHNKNPKWVTITSIEPVPRAPVRCIAVDSDDHLFAAGVGGHLTHNTEEWVPSNGGVKLFETVKNNTAKVGGSFVESPNAFIPGEGSVAEQSAAFWASIREGRARDDGLHYDHREAPGTTDLEDRESLVAGLRLAYGDSSAHPGGCVLHEPACPPGHVDLDVLVATIWDSTSDVQVSRSDFLNQVTHASDSWLSQPEWAGCADVTKVVADKETITLGFDGSRSRVHGATDATALIACRVEDGHIFEPLDKSVWEQPAKMPVGPDGKPMVWQVPITEVLAAVRECFRRYNVVGFYADPAKWEGHIADWEATYGSRLKVKSTRDHPIEWWMVGGRSRQIVRALEQFHSAVVDREMTHDGSYALTRHILNSRRRYKAGSGMQIAKEHKDSANKIDGAVAAVLAWTARLDAVAAGVQTQQARPYRVKRIR